MSEAGKRLIESARQALEFAQGTSDTNLFRVQENTDSDISKNSKNQHVIKRDNGWAVRSEGNARDTVIKPTQQEAIEQATAIAKNTNSEVVIHGRDGRIRKRSYPIGDKKIS